MSENFKNSFEIFRPRVYSGTKALNWILKWMLNLCTCGLLQTKSVSQSVRKNKLLFHLSTFDVFHLAILL